MVHEIICLDTSILIDYFRKVKKENSFFYKLAGKYDFAISVITKLEILNGSNEKQKDFWSILFERIQIIPLGEKEVELASEIIKKLRSENKLIELPDILIGSTALCHQLKLATLNDAHFKRINHLDLILNQPSLALDSPSHLQSATKNIWLPEGQEDTRKRNG